ncbi:MAG: T9SS type A sorting domain-containing protein [Crocinitomicaceae bacterium]|nr:T9SS type A sorting domain-containing protein [Crocinitomicaceae bacterium]
MKIMTLTLAFAAVSTLSWGQEQTEKIKFDRQTTSQQKDVVGGWYNYGEMLFDAGYDVNYYRNYLFPDSTVQVEFSSGYGAVWKHGMGQTFDPTSDNWGIGGIIPIDIADPYTVDSISIWYQYHRHQDLAPDTLKVQVWSEAAMTLYSDPWSNGKSYATAQYDYTTNLGVGAAQEYTILLDYSDTITSGQNTIDIAVNFVVNPNEIMGVTVAYFPGNPYNFGDTIDQFPPTPVTNNINAFIMYDYSDNDLTNLTGFYEHCMNVTKSIRYDQNSNGWNGQYHPGIAYFDYTDHNDISFHVVGTLGLDEQDQSDFMLYPNPAQETLNLTLNDGVELNSLKVVDITGKDVSNFIEVNGNTINVERLANGNYLLIHEKNNETTAKKFVVNH